MTTIMTPSAVQEEKTTTEGQITKATSNFRAILEKHASEFNSKAVQTVLGQPEFAVEIFTVFRERVEAVSNVVIRRVKVDRGRKPKDVLTLIEYNFFADNDVVEAMPKGEGGEVNVFFFKPDLCSQNGRISDDDLEKEFELRGLKPADPYSLAKVNQDDPTFADERPNGTHFKDGSGNWCFAAFGRRFGERSVRVNRSDVGWSDIWWFAGIAKR